LTSKPSSVAAIAVSRRKKTSILCLFYNSRTRRYCFARIDNGTLAIATVRAFAASGTKEQSGDGSECENEQDSTHLSYVIPEMNWPFL
jgi:hypothetical protein